ncbi:MAG: hypothetical protein E7Z97_09630 [Propionibacteriaceae bacterium]|uniref:ABC-2 family transporter protein n=1 Tax=Propionibacterium ruminifibrarum TaxID=1962131 RepID=A0A375I0X5_9ACTN|nr:hypothetical protein [Propionibacterium ruminifibrarum]MBE6478306.1 hypothetical protein [Propionibacteriaceae bacterium]SPF67717.1 Hypothetical protein PROPJV5_0676 [Propionibacterium ruminifibrarum]
MFTTLVGQEFRSHGRTCLVIVGLDSLTGLLLTGLGMLPVPVLGQFCAVLALVVLLAMPAILLVYLGLAYWQTMYGQRGYFTFALPVRGRQIFAAKLTHAGIWTLACFVLVPAMLLLSGWLHYLPADGTIGEVLDELLWEPIDLIGKGFFWAGVGAMIVSTLCLVVECAAVMSIGARSRWNRLGIGAPVIGFVLLEVVSQVLSVVGTLFIPVGVDMAERRIVLGDMATPLLEAIRTNGEPTVMGIGSMAMPLLLAAVLAVWAVDSIEHHTSLR